MDKGDFIMLRLETEFRDSVMHNAFVWETAPFGKQAQIRFDVVLENLWRYFHSKGGQSDQFIAMMHRQMHRIKGHKHN